MSITAIDHPPEILRQIFEFAASDTYEQIALVSKLWNECVKFAAWKHVKTQPSYNDLICVLGGFANTLDKTKYPEQVSNLQKICSNLPQRPPETLARILSYDLSKAQKGSYTWTIISQLEKIPQDDLLLAVQQLQTAAIVDLSRRSTLLFFCDIGLKCEVNHRTNQDLVECSIQGNSNNSMIVNIPEINDPNWEPNSWNIASTLVAQGRVQAAYLYVQHNQKDYAGLHRTCAEACIENNSVPTLLALLHMGKKDDDNIDFRSECYEALIETYLERKQLAEAIALIRSNFENMDVLKKFPCLKKIILTCGSLGKYEEALSLIQDLKKNIHPKDIPILIIELTQGAIEKGDISAAETLLDEYIPSPPLNLKLVLANAYVKNEDHEKASHLLDSILLETKPSCFVDHSIFTSTFTLLYQLKRQEDAIALMQNTVNALIQDSSSWQRDLLVHILCCTLNSQYALSNTPNTSRQNLEKLILLIDQCLAVFSPDGTLRISQIRFRGLSETLKYLKKLI